MNYKAALPTIIGIFCLTACRAGFDTEVLEGDDNGNLVTLQQLQNTIFTRRCAGCHGGTNPDAGMRLDTVNNTYNALVNVSSSQQPNLNRVAPRNPNNSYLIHKVEGRSSITNNPMPPNGARLSDAEIADVRSWINRGAPREDEPVVTLDQLQTNIFDPRCANCHNDTNANGNLRLDSVENSYNGLVNIRSSQQAGLNRVEPNDPNNSYLMHKVESRSSINGNPMPPNGASLSASQLADIRSWINSGAPQSNNSSQPTQVFTKSETLEVDYFELELEFGREIDFSLLEMTDIQITIRYADFTEQLHPSAIAGANSHLFLQVSLDTHLGKPQQIAVKFNHDLGMPVMDVLGRYVDGDADGLDGGEYDYQYIVVSPGVEE